MFCRRNIIFAIIAAFAISLVGTANATLRRLPRTWLWGPTPVWTNGTTNTPMFFPLSEPMESAGLVNVRVSTEMSQDSGNCKIRPAIRFSDDTVAWDGSKDLVATYRTTEGVDSGTTYIDILTLTSTTPRAFMQFGVQAVNETGNLIEHCNATIRIEPKQTR